MTTAAVDASMGPRPRGRGIPDTDGAQTLMTFASMGPRPRGRGIARGRHPISGGPDCFNGAATARSRNYINCPRVSGKVLASMGPRPRGRGIESARSGQDPLGRLQWGRDRAVAELYRGPGHELPGREASMGPRPRGRGIRVRRGSSRGIVRASMGPRPRGRGISGSVRSTFEIRLLQWGRDRAVAELLQPTPQAALPLAASMGPRPRGRGILVCKESFCPMGIWLQWGRDRAVAEFFRDLLLEIANGWLQWGRDRAVAEF